ncbi:hypothetical protein KC960_01810 [Candidatus Saccharibacteria bacterium]|nr:hypothetical protein [Candidatus Saccharibacteria bacterium]
MSDMAYFYDPNKTFEDNCDNGPFNMDLTSVKNTGEPQYEFLGHKVYLPFGIPAGPLPTSKHTTAAFKLGYDVVVYKTQRTVPFTGNKFPHILSLKLDGDLTLEKAAGSIVADQNYPEDLSKLTITNSFGMPSQGPDFWIDDLKKAIAGAGKGQLLIMSVVGTIQDGFTPDDYYNDFAYGAQLAADAGAPVIEVNLSCPNVATEGVLCYSPESVLEICKRAKKAIGDVPLLIKIGYYRPDQQDLLEEIVEQVSPYVAGISSINTIAAAVVDKDGNQALEGEGRLKSGCCGAGIRWAGLEMTKRLDEIRKRKGYSYAIIGVGGVMTPDDYKHYVSHGADCVMSATGAMWNQYLARDIKASL